MLPELQFAILDLNARYAWAIDQNRLEEWPEFFTASARYVVTTAPNVEQQLPLGMIYATSRAMLQDRVCSPREANIYEAQRYRHVVGLPLLEPTQDGVPTANQRRGTHDFRAAMRTGPSEAPAVPCDRTALARPR